MAAVRYDLSTRARRIRLLLLDVDGVLTDGTVFIDSVGGEAKMFNIRDGAGIVWAMRLGLEVGFLSGRASGATTRRASELGVRIVSQSSTDKAGEFSEIVHRYGLSDEEVAYMGDDVLDLPVLSRAGLSAAPADAVEEVRSRVSWVSQYAGGRGAVREFIEVIMRAKGTWDAALGKTVS
jgi:3-deoxy-D-manno-octulosonate 8-phosphate phosphatase (KDO 8-P phosphatase)